MAYLSFSCSFSKVLISITVLWVWTSAQTVIGPVSVTSMVGSFAIFNCSGPSADSVTLYSYTPTVTKLFLSPNTLFVNPQKYSVTVNDSAANLQTYILNISTLVLRDGGSYGCDRTSAANILMANLLVVATPVPQLLPLAGQQLSYYQNLLAVNVGNVVTMSCQFQYGSAPSTGSSSFVNSAQIPQGNMYFGNQFLTTTSSSSFYQTAAQSSVYTATLTWNYTIPTNVAGEIIPLTCGISTTYPAYTGIGSMQVNVNGPVTALLVTENTNTSVLQYYCSADGFPPPTVAWVPAQGFVYLQASDGGSGTGNATLTPSTYGQQTWNCTASYSSRGIVMWNIFSFNNTGIVTVSNNGLNPVNLGVGLGIGLGVPFVIGIIVLILFLIRGRKNRQQLLIKQKVSPPRLVSASFNNGSPPPKMQKGVSNNSVNPNPDSTTGPLLPKPAGGGIQTVSRNSHGFGDLGVKQMTGTVPTLDDSFNSNTNRSFDHELVPTKPAAAKKVNGSSSGYTSSNERHSDV